MKYITLFLCLYLCSKSELRAQQSPTIPVMDLEQYKKRVLQDNDTVYVVNFWATWCVPCVEELPYFGAIDAEWKGKPVKFLLMSLDAKNMAFKITPFLARKYIDIEWHLFSAGDPNVWINKIDKRWEGSIPATIVYKNKKVLNFHEGQFDNKEQLEQFITQNQ